MNCLGENDYTMHVGLKLGCIVTTLIDEFKQGKTAKAVSQSVSLKYRRDRIGSRYCILAHSHRFSLLLAVFLFLPVVIIVIYCQTASCHTPLMPAPPLHPSPITSSPPSPSFSSPLFLPCNHPFHLLIHPSLPFLLSQGKRVQRAYVRTDGGLRGSISVYDLIDEMIDVDVVNLADYIQVSTSSLLFHPHS
jgi:hypothetical protein